MLRFVALAIAIGVSAPAAANSWKKNYTPWMEQGSYIHSEEEPKVVPSTGSAEADLDAMYRAGYVPIGISQFTSGNNKTRDGRRWAKELGASFLIVFKDLQASKTVAVPLTMPSSSTTVSNGTAQVTGTGGSATGSFNGSSTTYGTSTSYIPITKNTYAKGAVYFAEAPKIGAGIYARQMTASEVSRLETRRAVAVRFIRDGSPAYMADILPNDIILEINGKAADGATWWSEIMDDKPDALKIDRGGKLRELTLVLPPDWRTIPAAATKTPSE